MSFTTAFPIVYCDDLPRTLAFYRDRLGFRYERFWGDPPEFCMVHRAGVVVMLSAHARASGVRPNRTAEPGSDAWDAYVWVDDADALYHRAVAAGATSLAPPADQFYGDRVASVEDSTGTRWYIARPAAQP